MQESVMRWRGWVCCVFLSGDLVLGLRAAGADDVDPRRPAAIVTTGVPTIPASLAERLRQYQSVRSAGFRGWSPQGDGILVQTQFGNSSQLHRVFTPGGRREQVTFLEEPVDGRFVPAAKGGELLLTFSRGGDENFQLMKVSPQMPRPELWTDGRSRHLLGPMSQDGRFAVVSSNRMSARDMDLYVVPLAGTEDWRTLLKVEGASWSPTDLAADGSRLLLYRNVSINETYPAVLQMATGQVTPFVMPPAAAAKAAWSRLKFVPGSSLVYAVTDALSEFNELVRVDPATGQVERLSAEWQWDVEELEVDPKTGRVACIVNRDGAGVVCLLQDDTLQPFELPLGQASGLEFSPDGQSLGLTLSPVNGPSDAYSIGLENGQLTQWTFSEAGGLDRTLFATAEVVRYQSFDHREIPAYVMKPKRASKDEPAPVVVLIHGGPESQSRLGFSAIDQFYVQELGLAIVTPNVRGSAGYGKTYLTLDNAEKREDSVKDIGALLDWIATQPELDASRVAVIGGSYGGYMVLASLVHYSDRLKAGIDIVGIANFVTFLENTSEYRRDLRRVEYGDERDAAMREVFERINPTANTNKIRAALMVVHGMNDPRVPFSEAEQIAPLVEKNGVPVWTLYANNEGHGFRRRDNRDYLTAAMVLFLCEQFEIEVP